MPDESREGSVGSEQEATLDIHSEDSNTKLRREAGIQELEHLSCKKK